MKSSHDGSHESPQYDDSTVLPRSDNSLSQQSKPLRRSSKSIQNLKKAQRNGLDKISPGTYHDPDDLLSVASAALHPHQAQISPDTAPTSKVDGVVPLAATRREIAEHSPPVSLQAKGGRNDSDVVAITNALHQGMLLNLSNLNPGSNAIKIEPAMASAWPQSAPTPSAEFQPSAGISLATEGDKQISAQKEAAAASPTPEGEFEYESAGDESETEPGAGLAQEDNSSAEGLHIIASRAVVEDEAQEEEVREKPPEMMAMRMEVNSEAEADAEAEAEEAQEQDAKGLMLVAEAEADAAEADAEVESIMSIEELRSAQESEDEKKEAEATRPPLEIVESKQKVEEDVLFAAQNEYKQQEEEKAMAKLFELPQLTPEQMQLNKGIKEASALIDEGRPQVQGREHHVLAILGATESCKSTLSNMLSNIKMRAKRTNDDDDNEDEWDISVAGLEGHYEGAAAGRASPIGHDMYKSQTRIPHKSTVDGVAILDVPGFFDTKGFPNDLAHRMLYELSLENTTSLKFILTVPADLINSSQKEYKALIKLITHFGKMFNNIEAIEGSVALVVTKSESTFTARQYSTKIKKTLKNNPLLQKEEGALVKQVLEYVQDSVKVFYKPEHDGEMKQTLTLKDFADLSYSTDHRSSPALSPSPQSSVLKNFLTGSEVMFLEKHNKEAIKTLAQLQHNIKIASDIIINFFKEQLALNDPSLPEAQSVMAHKSASFVHKSLLPKGEEQNIFSRVYNNFTKELLPESYHSGIHPEEKLDLTPTTKEGGFLKLRQISLIKTALESSLENHESDVEKLAMVLKILKNLYVNNKPAAAALDTDPGVSEEAKEDQDMPMNQKIGAFLHVLEGLVKFEESCRKLCSAPLSENPLAQTVSECNTFVQGIFKDAINLLAQAPKKFDSDLGGVKEYHYRIEAINWLNKLPHQTAEIKAALVNHYYSLGLIDGDDQLAIKWYEKAIALNPEMKNAHEKLGDIYFKHAQYCAHEAYKCEKQDLAQMIKSGKPLEPDEGLPMLLIDQHFGGGGRLFGINQNVTPPQPAHDYSKQLMVDINPAQNNTQKYVQKSLDLYKAALEPLIKAGNPTKIEECFMKILGRDPYNVIILEKLGDYYATLPTKTSAAIDAYYKAKELLLENPQNQEAIILKVINLLRNPLPLSSHPIFKDYAGSMIDVSPDSSAAAITSFDINMQQTPLSPMRSVFCTPAPGQRVLDFNLDSPHIRSMDVSPSRSGVASPVRPDTPEPMSSDFNFLDIGAAKFAGMSLAGSLPTVVEEHAG